MKFKVLQEVVNKRYYIHPHMPKGRLYWYDGDNAIEDIKKVKTWLDYDIESEVEIVDRELLCKLEKYDMEYKIGDKIWIENIPYNIKQIKYERQSVKLYIDKQHVINEINKKGSEELLEKIKIRQRELIEEKEKQELEQNIKDIECEQLKNKSLTHKIKKYLKGDKYNEY